MLPYDDIPKLEEGCTKILAFGKSKKNMMKLKEKLMTRHINIAINIVSRGYAFEITSIKASKGLGDNFICKLLNINPKHSVHIGDSGNDLTTKPYVGSFIAMSNSIKLIKNQAHYIGCHFKKAGLAKLLLSLTNFNKDTNH